MGSAIIGAVGLAIVLAFPAAADLRDEQALAERYAPVVRLVVQPEECGPGEPYEPMDVDRIFGQSTVALRGPWNATDLVKIGPTAKDVAGLYEYHLDFPGNALDPGCDYERWARRLTTGYEPAVYAHVATDPADPDKLALQYWLFYPFNDFNNTHEGDWEMIQLVFDAPDAATALTQKPVEVGYSSHEGAEKADWGEDKLEIVDGTHPVVYPAAGSHANKYTAALYLGSSAEAGVGCDDTQGPHRELRPVVLTIPSDPAAAAKAYPWITFEGRWGELQRAFFNGPTGPNMKTQWTAPIEWAADWRDRSYAVPAGGVLGTGATDLFCSGVERGSAALSKLLLNPGATVLVLGLVIALLVFAIVKATWTPVAPLRVGRRRSWGQILSVSGRMYVKRFRLFVGLGGLLIPITVVITAVQWLLVSGIDAISSVTGNLAGSLAYLALVVGTTLTLLGLALVQAATACALIELDAGRDVGPVGSYRLALRRIRPLLGAIAIFVAVLVVLTTTVVGIPVAVWLGVRWSLLAPVVELEDRRPYEALRRSGSLVRGRWIRVGSLVGVSGLLALAAGPLIGALLIFVSDTSLALLNIVAGIVYAIALPFVALVTAYVYFDARARLELEPRDVRTELPAEVTIEPA
jgi:hypothetical protein